MTEKSVQEQTLQDQMILAQSQIILAMMEEMKAFRAEIATLKTSSPNGRGGGRAGGRQTAKPVLDTKTGKVYRSEASAGMAVAPEYGLPAVRPDGRPNSFVWYSIKDKDTRFKLLTPEEYEAHMKTPPVEAKVEAKTEVKKPTLPAGVRK